MEVLEATTATDPGTPPLGYRLELIGRNLLGELHRGSLLVDLDAVDLVHFRHHLDYRTKSLLGQVNNPAMWVIDFQIGCDRRSQDDIT